MNRAEAMALRADAGERVRQEYRALAEIFADIRGGTGAGDGQERASAEPAEPAAAPALGDADDAVGLVLAIEDDLAAAASEGVAAAGGAAGGDGVDARAIGVDAALGAAERLGAAGPDVSIEAATQQLLRVARNAGLAAAVVSRGSTVVQRFGEPWCPAGFCYGRDGMRLSAGDVASLGAPPYAPDCNCRFEPAAD